jgi:glutamate-1-semialdehyde 2,1-aminomutase
MRRFRDDRPADICFARGPFNSHSYVMTAMDEFLTRLASSNFNSVYRGLDETWNGRAKQLNITAPLAIRAYTALEIQR